MAAEVYIARESNVKALNAASDIERARRQRAYYEFAQQRDRYRERLREAEDRYNYSSDNRERYAAEKAVEYLNFRIREMEANMKYIKMTA